MQLYFMRHGHSVANELAVFSNRDQPHPLTALGREQVRDASARLGDLGIDAIYTSPVPRARESANVVGRRTRPRCNRVGRAAAQLTVNR